MTFPDGGIELAEVRVAAYALGSLRRDPYLDRCREVLKKEPRSFRSTGHGTPARWAGPLGGRGPSEGASEGSMLSPTTRAPPPVRPFLYLCSTRRLSAHIQQELAARNGGAALTGSVLTLEELLDRYTSPSERISDAEVRLRLWSEMRRSPGRSGPGGTLGFVSELVDLWGLVRQEGAIPGGPSAGTVGLGDDPHLQRLLGPVEAIERAFLAEGRRDQVGLLLDLPRRISEEGAGFQLVIVDGFEGYPPAFAAVVEALAARSEETWVLVEGDTLHPPGWTADRAAPPSTGTGTSRSHPAPAGEPTVPGAVLDAWARSEERRDGPAPLPRVRLLDGLGGEREEVEALASEVRAILEREPQATVLLALPALPTYAGRIREVFPRFGLRPEVPFPQPLVASPAAQPVRRLLELLDEGFPHGGVMELLEDLQALGTLSSFFAPGSSVEDLDRVTREARCVEGEEAFTTALRESARGLGETGPGSEAERWERAADGFSRLFGVLGSLRGAHGPVPFVVSLRAVMRTLGYLGGRAKEEPEQVLATLEDAARAVEASPPPAESESSGGGSRRWSFGELRQLAETALALGVAPGRSTLPGVPVTGLHDAGLVEVDHLLLGGLSERNLPSDRPSPLLSAATRARLGLPSGEELVHRERVRLSRVLARARLGVVLSYPARAGDEEVLPSLLLNDLLSVASPVRVERTRTGRPVQGPYSLAEAMAAAVRGEGTMAGPGGPEAPKAVRASPVTLTGGGSPGAADSLQRELSGPRGEAWRSMLLGVRAERERRTSPRSTPLDGPTGGGPAQELARRRFEAARFTVHDVQDYLRCPYRFYLEKVLGLAADEEVTDEVDRPALGSAVHRELFLLHNRHRGRDGAIVPLDAKQLEEERARVHAALEEFLRALRPRSPELEAVSRRLLGPPGDPGAGTLAQLLERLAEDDAEVRVSHVELPFDDREPRDPQAVDPVLRLPPLPLGDVGGQVPRLVGRIDRLGFGRARPSGLVIDDYKTGLARPKDQDAAREAVPSGLELQLPLYMAAALHGMRASDPSLFPLGMRYLWLSSGEETGFIPFLRFPRRAKDEPKQLERGIGYVDLALRHASNAAKGILEGRFPINGRFSNSEGGCQFAGYCDHARGCRFDLSRLSLQEGA